MIILPTSLMRTVELAAILVVTPGREMRTPSGACAWSRSARNERQVRCALRASWSAMGWGKQLGIRSLIFDWLQPLLRSAASAWSETTEGCLAGPTGSWTSGCRSQLV
jgi:hypothetical protein